LTHDERGYPVMTAAAQDKLIRRLVDKIRRAAKEIAYVEAQRVDDAEVLVVSYGITSRIAVRAAEAARGRGVKVGLLRLKTIWPFPEHLLLEALRGRVRSVVVPELNLGQIVLEVERAVRGKARVVPVSHAGGTVHEAQVIADAILEASR
jgi:2-oxoglutarate ferredoxin oxidoreductase subunit alpha